MKDRFNREIDNLRISLTDRCNLRCTYCMSEDGCALLPKSSLMGTEEVVEIVRVAAELGVSSIRLTGGEPLVRRDIVEIIARAKGIDGIDDVSITTNGTMLPQKAQALKAAGLDRVNISLDTLDADQYRSITRCGNLSDVMTGIDAALEAGLSPVKINTVALRNGGQDFLAFALLTIKRALHLRFCEYMPVDADATGWEMTRVITCEKILQEIQDAATAAGLGALAPALGENKPFGRGGAYYYAFEGAQGTVGFITSVSKHFCGSCNRMRITADGKLRPCLFSDAEVNILDALRQGGPHAAKAAFLEALSCKPEKHVGNSKTHRAMSQIGG